MTDRQKHLELISALVDGQLQGESFDEACALALQDDAAHEAWISYHLIGDALRSNDLPATSATASVDFVSRLRSRLGEPVIEPLQMAPVAARIAVAAPALQAANDSVFRWKMVAGFATLAAVAVIGWTSLQGLVPAAQESQLAQAASATEPVQAASGVVTASAQTSSGVMIRDPRLDELLAAHRQNGGATALQMPSGFLRNATFDGPNR